LTFSFHHVLILNELQNLAHFLQQLYQEHLPKADAFHSVSEAIKNEVKFYGANFKKIFVVYSGLRLSDFNFKPRVKVKDNTLRIISVGRPHWIKNYASAILAIKKLNKKNIIVHYTIIGGLCEEFQFMVTELGLKDNVLLQNNLPFSEVQKYLKESDLFILSSVVEGIANVVLEAMALGIPVITTNCGGMVEVVNTQNGWLVPIRDEDAIVDAVLNYLQCGEETLNNKIKAARQTIERQHSEKKMVDEMTALYQGLFAS
jgi:colanic acid/amylovoran biosynthesis glycosyltransferase